ncbi:L-idonate 5-dehydrogenase, partial [Salmonella enterica subsp. enterica serovar Goldcoast]
MNPHSSLPSDRLGPANVLAFSEPLAVAIPAVKKPGPCS